VSNEVSSAAGAISVEFEADIESDEITSRLGATISVLAEANPSPVPTALADPPIAVAFPLPPPPALTVAYPAVSIRN